MRTSWRRAPLGCVATSAVPPDTLSTNQQCVDISAITHPDMIGTGCRESVTTVGEVSSLPGRATCAKLTDVTCPSCGRRKGRRDCPALRASICTICCGTKRLVEINCPETCVHLTSAREHPAAVVKKQQERDVAQLLPTISHLTERQHQLFLE